MMQHECYRNLTTVFNSQDSAVLVTVEADGRLRTSHITHPFLDGAGNLWFFACSTAPLVCHIEANPEVCIFCSNALQPQAISLSGTGFVITNVVVKRKLSANMRGIDMHTPIDTGDVVLVRVALDYAEYHDAGSDKPLRLTRASVQMPITRPHLVVTANSEHHSSMS